MDEVWDGLRIESHPHMVAKHRTGILIPMEHLSRLALEAGLEHVRRSPRDEGTVLLIACRPDTSRRQVLEEAVLDCVQGVIGDNWRVRGSRHTPDGSALIAQQVTVTNARVASLVAVERERWALCGDQFYVDLDLGHENLPAGSRLAIGAAVIEVSAKPHVGCWKYEARFGRDAMRFVNSKVNQPLRLRGFAASIVVGGTVRTGDIIRKLPVLLGSAT
jgi:hypothetical protein